MMTNTFGPKPETLETKIARIAIFLAEDIAATHRENGTRPVDPQRMVNKVAQAAHANETSANRMTIETLSKHPVKKMDMDDLETRAGLSLLEMANIKK